MPKTAITPKANELLHLATRCPKCGADWNLYMAFLNFNKAYEKKFKEKAITYDRLRELIESCDLCQIYFADWGLTLELSNKISAIIVQYRYSKEDIAEHVKRKYNKTSKDLNSKEAEELIIDISHEQIART